MEKVEVIINKKSKAPITSIRKTTENKVLDANNNKIQYTKWNDTIV